ncbi:restriction endonuclease subunit S [Ruminobacter amylophilus]|nr:restriction endonuclease subunit S [Ruminobacter amylophilus]
MLRITDIQDGKVEWDKVPFTTLQSPEQYRLMTGDIVFARTGATVGKSFLIKELPFDSVYASYLIRIRVIGKLSRDYVYDFFNSKCYWNQITDKSVGVGQPNCNGSSLKELLIPVPPINEQELIIKSIKNLQLYSNIIESQQTDLKSLLLKCKSKILDLAIRGKLVSQDPNDEPASKLLERIRHEKEELIKAGKLKRDKRESVIFRGEDNSYYLRTGKLVEPLTDWSFDNLPTNWEICCFGEICNYGDCINTESSVIENSAWILDLEDIEKDTGRIISRVSKADRPSISTKHKFHKGQVLYSKLRPYLNKVVLADRDGYCTSEILPLEFHAEIIPEYARYYLMSPTFLRYADKCSYGVKMPRLGTNDGKKAIFPLPPVNEQKRIVKQIEFMFSHLSVIETSVQ